MLQPIEWLRHRHRATRPETGSHQRMSARCHALRLLRRPAVLGFAFALVVAGASTAAAHDRLEVFNAGEIAAPASAREAEALAALREYGDVTITGDAGVQDVPDAEVAAVATGLEVPVVSSLPRGVTGVPAYKVAGKVSVTFTFSTERARGAVGEAGSWLASPLSGLDGAVLHVDAGPGLAAVWSHESGLPRLVVARAVAPKITSSSGVLEAMRDSFESMPGAPVDVVAQLRNVVVGDLSPLSGLADRISTSTSEVNGVAATVAAAHDESFAAVAWVNEGIATVVAGSLDTDEILSVARNL